MTQVQTAVERAVRLADGQVRLAEIAGVSAPFVWQWLKGMRPVPPIAAVRIERRLAVSRRDLRPADWGDIWPELIDDAHPWAPAATERTEQRAA